MLDGMGGLVTLDKAFTRMERTNFLVNGTRSSLVKPSTEQASFRSKGNIFLCVYEPVDAILFSLFSWTYRIILKPTTTFILSRFFGDVNLMDTVNIVRVSIFHFLLQQCILTVHINNKSYREQNESGERDCFTGRE
ncbi:hypothetical protein BRADI_4g16976v3 [Brachypodium distachyon]|uniref:Uncharacterized protein n=1 Tax=Brachypodium distachyon TaxID=15368 RepID=A0A2K2CNB3_BRADI|nr:hypothetical protein BRADI_4g16976v3 [Brachypodium distachyon]